MEKFKVSVAAATILADAETGKPSVNIAILETIPGIKKENGEFIDAEVNSINISPKALTAQLAECNDLVAEYRGSIDHPFGQKEFGIILRGAKLTVERSKHEAGDEIPDTLDAEGNPATFQRTGYSTTVLACELTERVINKLEKATDL